jgi:PIN domain nuclease of toxin-antitoxin system
MDVFNSPEVVSHFIHLGMPEGDVYDILDPLPIAIIPVDRLPARETGWLRATAASASLSLGDRFCLAPAKRVGLPAWTADAAWASIADAVGITTVIMR